MASASVSAAAVAGRKIFGSLRPLRRFPAGLVSRRIWPTDCVDGVGPRLVPDGLASSSSSRCFSAWRASSVTLKSDGDLDVAEVSPFPGARIMYTEDLQFVTETSPSTVPCFRVLSENGEELTKNFSEPDMSMAQKMYEQMVALQVLDSVFYNAQRQGRFGFYATCTGEEALNIACAAALRDNDSVFPQYREPGVLLWRGYRLQEFADHCIGNYQGHGKGRQMSIHYGSNKLHYFTVSSVLATQIPHAVGAAYSLKMENKQRCSVTFFGEGAASEGDFHGAINFAAVLEVPILFICRNNGWAISTPASQQYRGDGIAGRGQAYGVKSIRVDGNDALAVFSAVKAARQLAVENNQPVLLELMTYRVGHHSTSDDSAKYREVAEIRYWSERRDGVARFRKWIESKGWWDGTVDEQLRKDLRTEVIACLAAAEAKEKPPLSDLFSDVYDSLPKSLEEQEKLVRQAVQNCPQMYPADIPL
ncbi:2-oxoisovalerate dehydrogenase E1 component subunit alpha [Marchantia polymorpha subsp. ruderalis]|uniref:3-methyl-2-oxobutanoate dehydrogenase (2-methylpropanoyl-transferring) n=2 Tax=Marchantia polymorpha TaxID=3197 RepID=A0AAF6AY22_MARPO|nr:hypothetical protein MARPO_0006s0123 [Marchantia polymorpha]BBN04656.1 hypothetical protein Mp_3g06540 [Marchantia polymorpha subsp. ruderalis]|eukprot:PTQ48091.1 hypothetical protein MARPO_0006s0123 [Marchantia polymorpha]